MQKLTVKEIYKNYKDFLNREVRISGWVRTVRSSKEVGFMALNDGSFFYNLQVVIDKDSVDFDAAVGAAVGSAVEAAGKIVESPAAGQPFELRADKVRVISAAAPDYPLQKKRHSFEFLRTIAHLRARSNTFSAVFRLRSKLDFAIHKFFQDKNFVYVHTPILTGNDCEGAGEMFRVLAQKEGDKPGKEFFGRRVGLTVSGQLNAEALAMAFKKVYTFGPTFRAENSNTSRHAAEFWMVEPEMAFADLDDDMVLAEEMVKYLIGFVLKECPEEMEFFNKFIDRELRARLNNVAGSDFKRISYAEAVDILEKSGEKFKYPVKWGADLQSEHERYITERVFKKPVFVVDYPKNIKAFYMRVNDDGRTVAAVDLLAPGVGEIIGGSQREERLEKLKDRMRELGLNTEDYWWYLDIRRYGGVKHAGFGLGFERFIMYLTGLANIRDVILFPRVPNNVDF